MCVFFFQFSLEFFGPVIISNSPMEIIVRKKKNVPRAIIIIDEFKDIIYYTILYVRIYIYIYNKQDNTSQDLGNPIRANTMALVILYLRTRNLVYERWEITMVTISVL